MLNELLILFHRDHQNPRYQDPTACAIRRQTERIAQEAQTRRHASHADQGARRQHRPDARPASRERAQVPGARDGSRDRAPQRGGQRRGTTSGRCRCAGDGRAHAGTGAGRGGQAGRWRVSRPWPRHSAIRRPVRRLPPAQEPPSSLASRKASDSPTGIGIALASFSPPRCGAADRVFDRSWDSIHADQTCRAQAPHPRRPIHLFAKVLVVPSYIRNDSANMN